ncbi:MAG: hypothetical protein ACE5IM_14125, partial [Nitrospinota bacterium]
RLEIGPLSNFLLLPTIRTFSHRVTFLWESCFPRDDVMRQIYASYRPSRRGLYCALRGAQLVGLGVSTALRLFLSGPRRRRGAGAARCDFAGPGPPALRPGCGASGAANARGSATRGVRDPGGP